MTKRSLRALAIDPNSRGFGFVVLEGPDRLVDWGIKDIREDKETKTNEKASELIGLYRPGALVLEDCDDPTSRRSPRSAKAIADLAAMAAERNVAVWSVSRGKVQAFFAREGARTKNQINAAIVRWFPELAPYRPPVRKPWMSEDQRQAVFDAVALTPPLLGWSDTDPCPKGRKSE